MYPIMMQVKNKPIIVVGGGKVAARKINTLLPEGPNITVISSSLHETIDQTKVTWLKKHYETGDLIGAALIFACTNDDQVNEQVLADAADSQWVNVTSDKTISEFFNVATTKVNDLSVSVSTGGVSPTRAKKIRQKIADYLRDLEV